MSRKQRNFAVAAALAILLLAVGIAIEWGTPWSPVEAIGQPVAAVASGFTAELQSDRLQAGRRRRPRR